MNLIKKTFWDATGSKVQSGCIIAAALALAFVPKVSSDVYTPLFLSWIMAYCIMSLSWSFFSGKAGYVSLATASFYGVGMYLQAILGRELPLWTNMILAAAFAFCVGIVIGIVTLRLRGIYFTIFTFGLTLFLNKFFHWYEGTVTRTKGRMVKPYDNITVFYSLLVLFAITVIAMLLLNKSKFGLSLKCIGQNEDSAQHLGVSTTKSKVLAFALSAAPVGAVGAIMCTKAGYIDPDTAFGLNYSFFPVLMAIFGGMASTYGPIVGSVIFFVLQDYLLRKPDEIMIFGRQIVVGDMIIFGAVMVIVILAMPKGLFGTIETLIAKRRKRAQEVPEDA
ncbi:MAG: branched-chain amino acid ABC transporter permease [Oscillospiraceae bacterium]|nr:branched-chain amino acid ABC transporter permease [Oscillospiraceae bacterium]